MRTRTKILATSAIVGVIGVLIAVGTSALFSSSATSDVNIAATGALSISQDNSLYFDSATQKMKPIAGTIADARTAVATITGDVEITNNTGLGVDLTLTQQQVGGTSLAPGTGLVGANPALFSKAQVCISVAPANDCSVHSGPFDMLPVSTAGTGDSVQSNAVALAPLAGSASRTYNFEVWLPNDAQTDNSYQNQVATAIFRFNAS